MVSFALYASSKAAKTGTKAMKRYVVMLYDLEDITFYVTEDEALFTEAEAEAEREELCEWLWGDENNKKFETVNDLTGIEVLGFACGLQY